MERVLTPVTLSMATCILNPPATDDEDGGFGSNHADVIPFAFCDSSVRPMSIETDIDRLDVLATRPRGELKPE